MHIGRSLFQNQSFALTCFEHPPQPNDCGDGDKRCSAYAVNFVEAGSFERRDRFDSIAFDQYAFMFSPSRSQS
jgi:hypothetical protein